MKKKPSAAKTITVHVYGSRCAADKKAADRAYAQLGTGKEMTFPREGQYAHSFGIPITGNREEIAHYIWQFTCIAEISASCYNKHYQFIVHHFDGVSVEEIAPLFYESFKIPCITLPGEYHTYIESITTARGLPSLQDINVHDSLDERSAVRNFLGKTQDDIYRELKECIGDGVSLTESFYYLGPIAFAYYVQAWERLYLEYQGRICDDESDDYDEAHVATETLFFLSQRDIMQENHDTPQGITSRLHLLELCEQHYSSAVDYHEEGERQKALKRCKKLRESLKA